MFEVKAETNFNINSYLDATKYNGDGLYLNDDGLTYSLVSVVGSYATALLIERKYIVKHKQLIGESGIDLLQKQLAELNESIKDTHKFIENEFPQLKKNYEDFNRQSSSQVDLAGLTKLIAVAQKPDLLKGK